MDWILMVVGLTGFILAGQKIWWCWYVNFFCQFLWFAYGFLTEQWGFVAASLFYMVVFGRNAYKWTEDARKNKQLVKPRVEKIAAEPIGTITDVEMVDDGLLVHGRFTLVPEGQVVYEDKNGSISIGPVVPPGGKRVGAFYPAD
jgi:hypothetical protein